MKIPRLLLSLICTALLISSCDILNQFLAQDKTTGGDPASESIPALPVFFSIPSSISGKGIAVDFSASSPTEKDPDCAEFQAPFVGPLLKGLSVNSAGVKIGESLTRTILGQEVELVSRKEGSFIILDGSLHGNQGRIRLEFRSPTLLHYEQEFILQPQGAAACTYISSEIDFTLGADGISLEGTGVNRFPSEWMDPDAFTLGEFSSDFLLLDGVFCNLRDDSKYREKHSPGMSIGVDWTLATARLREIADIDSELMSAANPAPTTVSMLYGDKDGYWSIVFDVDLSSPVTFTLDGVTHTDSFESYDDFKAYFFDALRNHSRVEKPSNSPLLL